jgi:large subunit ribosomal protein L30
MVKKNEGKILQITYVRSSIGYSQKHKDTIRALGFHRLHQTIVHPDTPALRGMLAKVERLVKVEEQEKS